MLRIGAMRPWLVWLLTSPSRLTPLSNLSTNTDPGPLHFETDASGKLMAARARCARGQLGRVPPVDFVVRLTAVKDGPRIARRPAVRGWRGCRMQCPRYGLVVSWRKRHGIISRLSLRANTIARSHTMISRSEYCIIACQ